MLSAQALERERIRLGQAREHLVAERKRLLEERQRVQQAGGQVGVVIDAPVTNIPLHEQDMEEFFDYDDDEI